MASRNAEALEEVRNDCEVYGASVLLVPTDVTDTAAVQTLADTAAQWGAGVDVWVNNAGLLAAGAFDETPLEVHQKVIDTNLGGYVSGAYAALKIFKRQDRGILINNISVGGWFPTPYLAAYSAAKFGIRGLGEALQAELHSHPHIHVCNVYPAFLDTPGLYHAANFTGKVLKPSPPVYDPQRVARVMARLAKHPRRTVSVGAPSTVLRILHAVAPRLSGWATATALEAYLKAAPPAAPTTGSVFQTVPYGTSVHGGWTAQPETKAKVLTAVGVAALVGGLLFLRRDQR